MVSSDTNPKTSRRIFPAAASNPTSAPPYVTTVRSRKEDARIARTSAMGFRREPQPPIPMVIPSDSSATTSAGVIRLSRIPRPVHEGGPGFVGGADQVQLERETLLVAVTAVDVLRVDAVDRLLRPADHAGVLGRDLLRQGQGGGVEFVAWNDRIHGTMVVQL